MTTFRQLPDSGQRRRHRQANVSAVLDHKALQLVNVGRTAINIDVGGRLGVVDNMRLGA